MTISELSAILKKYRDDVEVRIATQPSWPFEHEVGNVSITEIDEDKGEVVLYIGEGKQIGTLPQIVQKDLQWAPWGP